ncbi:hypothetical protein [Burkholderia sp. Bp8998]|uniref:hypothetical protein n=1 Tax=Burkholderia sp. Bp8998 TaxID=2184557 RepID=UPI000F59FB5F|nr:hypothetical protein [Burkholderia sp. Bp8998]RQS11608.1 hypothetical protein DIE06_27835 [Burkholderia sp. Bp8998]
MTSRLAIALCFAAMLAACAPPKMALKVTRTGGGNTAQLKTGDNGQPSPRSITIGDTVVASPGSMKTVVASSPVTYTLYEDGQLTTEEKKKALSVNQKDMPNIQFMKGELHNGDFMLSDIWIDLHTTKPEDFNRTLHYLLFNRGDKPFRGDLTVYDLLPPELELRKINAASKYADQTRVKGVLSMLPLIQYFAFAMDNYAKLDEPVKMKHEQLDGMHKYTFQRIVLEPGQAVGFTIDVHYVPPTVGELVELREDAKPLIPKQQF